MVAFFGLIFLTPLAYVMLLTWVGCTVCYVDGTVDMGRLYSGTVDMGRLYIVHTVKLTQIVDSVHKAEVCQWIVLVTWNSLSHHHTEVSVLGLFDN